MNFPKPVGWIGLVIGVVLVLLTVFAGQIGIGGGTWGLKHIVLLVVGIVLIAAGLFVALRSEASPSATRRSM